MHDCRLSASDIYVGLFAYLTLDHPTHSPHRALCGTSGAQGTQYPVVCVGMA